MKKFSKIMLSAVAVTAVSASMAIAAMADNTITGTYNAETGRVDIEGVVSSGASQTLLVLDKDAATVEQDDIAQIDQKDDGTVFTKFVLPSGLETGTYYIRIGGTNGSIQRGTLTINNGGGDDPVETVTIKIGDANLNDVVNINDVSQIAKYLVSEDGAVDIVGDRYKLYDANGVALPTLTDDVIIIGDANLNGVVNINDVSQIAKYLVSEAGTVDLINESIKVTAIAE